MKTFGTFWRTFMPPLGDAVLMYGSLALALALRQFALIDRRLYAFHSMEFTPVFLVWLGVLYSMGLYELRLVRDFVSLIRNLLASAVLIWFLGATYFYLRSTYEIFTPKTNLLLTVAIGHAAIFVWRRAWLWLLDFKLLDQKFVFLGDKTQARQMSEHLRQCGEDAGFSPVEWRWPGVDLVVADSRWVDENWDKAKEIFIAALRHKVPMVSFENFYESLFGKVSPEFANNPSWTMEFVLPKRHGLYTAGKRAFDLAASAAMVLLFFPVMAVIALIIRIADGSPVFYGQRRAGYLGEEFTLWKFRTMPVRAEKAGPFASAAELDANVSRLGGFLRRYRLDELPQLWNVLLGEMSLVGPRPEWVKEVEVLKKTVPNYHLRYLVPPGITGWAQVYFRATNNPNDSIEKLHYDLYYVKYFSPALDLSILLKTVKRVFLRDAMFFPTPTPAAHRSPTKKQWSGDLDIARNRK